MWKHVAIIAAIIAITVALWAADLPLLFDSRIRVPDGAH
jgi:hypothetical protein